MILKIASAKKTMRGAVFGIINKVVIIIMPFILRTIIIHRIGTDYAGLNSLFTSILRVLNMAELGFASAAAFSLYKPAAEDDTEKICALLSFYRKIYYAVGGVMLVIGLCLLPFLDHLIKGSYPDDINLQILYIIYLVDSASSYFLFSYKNLILNVYQRVDIISIISTILHMAVYLVQVVVLYVFRAYYAFVILDVVYTVLNNLFVARYVSKHYPQFQCRGTLSSEEKKDIIKNSYGMLLFRICNVTRNSLDTVFISAYIGLTAASIYGNYYYIFAGVASIQTIIRESMKGGIGNRIATQTPEKNHEEMMTFIYLYAWLSGICTVCLLCLYQPFVQIWVGKDLMLNEQTMIMFCAYFYIATMGSIRFLYHQSAGLFWVKRYWTLAEAGINLLCNWLFVQWWGMFGVITATIVSLLIIDFGYSTTIVYDYYFKNGKIKEYFLKHGLYLIYTFLGCAPAYFACKWIPVGGIPGLVIRLVVCLVISNAVFFVCYSRHAEFQPAKQLAFKVLGMVKKKRVQNSTD